jgi:type IV pilus assembly protein PilQ
MSLRWNIAGIALCTMLGMSAPVMAATPDSGAAVNTVNKLDVEEAAKGTTIRIRGSSVPTFSVFKLADPPRLFVDISNSQLSDDGAPKHINNGVISQVAMLSVRDATQSVTRVIVGFERAAHYDVRTEGNDVVVFIDGASRTSPALSANTKTDDAALRHAQAELAATQQRLQKADSELGATRSKLQSADGELAALRERIARSSGEQRQGLEREREALDKRIESLRAEERASARRAELAEAAATSAQKKAEESDRLARLQAQKAEKAEQRAQDSSARAATLQTSLDAANGDKNKLERSLEQTQAQAAEATRTLAQRNAELERTRARSVELETQIAALRTRADKGDGKASDQLKSLESERAALAKNLDKTRRDLEDAEARSRSAQAKLVAAERDLKDRDAELNTLRAEVATMRTSQQQREARPAARAVPVDATASNAVRDIRLETVNGRSRIIVELDHPGHFETMPGKNSRAVMILNNTELPERLEKTLRTRAQGGAVRFVSSFADKGQVRMEAELDGQTLETVRQDGPTLVWEFAPLVADAQQAQDSADVDPRPAQDGQSFTSAPPAVVTDPSKETGVPGMGKKRLSIDLRDADIQNVLRLISKEGGVNIIAGDDVKGTVTMRLQGVQLDQVFLTMLQSKSLGYEVRGNVIRVAPQDTLLKEEAARAEARAASQRLRPLEVFLLPVNYATADELVPQVQGLLSKRGTVSVDARTNMLIIKDLPENLNSIRALVENLDSQVPQVLIEARIVETNDTFQQQLGIQWGGDLAFSQANGNPTGLIFPSVLGLAGAASDGQTPSNGLSGPAPNFAVNLPAPIGTGSGGGIGLSMGSIGGAFNLSIRLSALEQAGSARIISAPKILTLDNRQASISQGTSIPISVVGAAGVQTVFVDATLQLTVTPHVTPDGNIRLQIQATKNEPDFQNTGARGDPTIIRRQAKTELLIKDGDTTVIGGIYTRNSGTSMSAVPFFHKIPILGFFFRNSSESERRNELLIFITPKIVNRAEALGPVSSGSIREDAPSGSGKSSDN